jgi:pimeloyl-ACP methyl ester carboxylesterase
VPGILVDVGGYRIHLYCTGKGKPPVMIVGAAFSFNWDLVQPKVAEFTHVWTFDPSGTACSDSFKIAARVLDPDAAPNSPPTCEDRVSEIQRLISRAPIDGPYILVGYSVGALWARPYATRYPENIVGVIVDEAFLPHAKAATPKRLTELMIPARGYTPPVLLSHGSCELVVLVANEKQAARWRSGPLRILEMQLRTARWKSSFIMQPMARARPELRLTGKSMAQILPCSIGRQAAGAGGRSAHER